MYKKYKLKFLVKFYPEVLIYKYTELLNHDLFELLPILIFPALYFPFFYWKNIGNNSFEIIHLAHKPFELFSSKAATSFKLLKF